MSKSAAGVRPPSKTVTTGSLAGALTIVLLWTFGGVWPDVYVPPEVAAAITVIISQVAAWIVPDPAKGAKH